MKILLIRLSSLGDLVIMTSALEYLKEKGKITLITRKQYFGLFEDDPRVSALVDEQSVDKLKNTVFDIACDLHAKPKTVYMLLEINARRKCIINKNPFKRRFAVWFKKKIQEVPFYKLYVSPFHRYFPEKTFPLPSLITNFRKMEDLPEKYIVMSPGASQPQKRWPLDYFVEMSKKIYTSYGFPSVYVGMEDFNLPSEDYIINKMGRLPLKELMNIIKFAEWVVSNDSGPAHMAAALSTPLFVLFGPTIPEFGFRPASRAPVVVIERHDLSCRPCSLHGEKKCKYGDLRCLAGIYPDMVFEKIKSTLNPG